MAIPRSESYAIPASEEKSFDSVWVRSINIYCPEINADGNTSGSISMELLPYDATSGSEAIFTTPDNKGVEYISIPNYANGTKSFWDAVDEVPEVAAAMQAILAAVGPLKAWSETVPVVEEPVEEPVEDSETLESE